VCSRTLFVCHTLLQDLKFHWVYNQADDASNQTVSNPNAKVLHTHCCCYSHSLLNVTSVCNLPACVFLSR
jgi:hypothetical protein